MTNPYQSPQAESTPPPPVGSPSFALYAPKDVFLAAFLGGLLAGAIIIALNYRRLARFRAADAALVVGGLAHVAVLGAAFWLPDTIPMFLPGLLISLGIWALAKELQEGAFALHLARGGKKASAWKAAGIGLLCGVATIAIALAAVVALEVALPGNGPLSE